LRDIAHSWIILKSIEVRGVSVVLSFPLNIKIEKQLKHLQNRLVELYKDLESAMPEEKDYLNRYALISNVGATTRIENAVLTDVEIEWVDTELSKDGKPTAFEQKKEYILNKLSKDRQRSVEEVVGSRSILTTVYQQAKELQPLSENVIRGLHHDLLRFYPPAEQYAGRYKSVSNRVVARNNDTGEERIVLDPALPGVITELAMRELVDWYNGTISGHLWPFLVAVEFTFRFLAIHPFQDGNGRMGRALFLLSLLQSGDKYLEKVALYIALDRKIEQNKAQYYTVLQQCSDGKYQPDPKAYHYDGLIYFMLKVMDAALNDIDVYRQKYRNLTQLSASSVTVLDCFKSSPEKQLQVAELEKITGLPRRTIQAALKTLTGQKFLQRLGQAAGSRYQLVF